MKSKKNDPSLSESLIQNDAGEQDNEDKDNGTTQSTTQSTTGLTTPEVENLYEKWGYNELPHIVVPLWYIFFLQFTGTMPYMLELACILSLAVADYVDFAIIAAMILCNGWLGFHEELKAKESLEELTSKMEQKICCLRDGHAVVSRNVLFLIVISSLSFCAQYKYCIYKYCYIYKYSIF
jgi:magnesium-transporting ATPase (P-type)